MYSYKMTKEKMKDLSDASLLELYEEFIKWNHYEAVDEFQYLKEMDVNRSDIRREIFNRMISVRRLD